MLNFLDSILPMELLLRRLPEVAVAPLLHKANKPQIAKTCKVVQI